MGFSIVFGDKVESDMKDGIDERRTLTVPLRRIRPLSHSVRVPLTRGNNQTVH
jgi:hypothetical protein